MGSFKRFTFFVCIIWAKLKEGDFCIDAVNFGSGEGFEGTIRKINLIFFTESYTRTLPGTVTFP